MKTFFGGGGGGSQEDILGLAISLIFDNSDFVRFYLVNLKM